MREAQLWIMANLNPTLFARIPDLVEAPVFQPPLQSEADEGAVPGAAGPEREAVCEVCCYALAASIHPLFGFSPHLALPRRY